MQYEKRSAYRFEVAGAQAFCRFDDQLARFMVGDLSLGGAKLKGSYLPLGWTLPFEFTLNAKTALIVGTVVRHHTEIDCIGISFTEMSDTAQDIIEEVVFTEVLRSFDPAVLIVHRSQTAAEQLAVHIRLDGYRVVIATTPLDAIMKLSDETQPIGVVVASSCIGFRSQKALVSFLKEEFPLIQIMEDKKNVAKNKPDIPLGPYNFPKRAKRKNLERLRWMLDTEKTTQKQWRN